jgi:hypothetical protein|tara:strand:+ start:727 stop:927 length:201 start_codon:yes stop_codon:yes gene_type:complete
MRTDNPFDKKIELYGKNMPAGLQDAFISVNDNLDICKAIVSTVWEVEPTPEMTLEVYDRVMKIFAR